MKFIRKVTSDRHCPIDHGTTLDGVAVLAKAVGLLGTIDRVLNPVAPSLTQMAVDSEFMKKLNNNTLSQVGSSCDAFFELFSNWHSCQRHPAGSLHT
ncbi:hypothetical protein BGZ92_006794 [Podila epicladia]|nr:hypothetical protein BGZ92_006794 [Podila epicladia]